ncbi:MAG TPA: hypothetical protein DDZ51_15555 [Planctomycetaceae bacterium]|nr:hypothetical protein [Planctomycetaceae bacterium]
MNDDRYYDIDNQIDDSGHRYNHSSGRFEATIGSDADNNLDHDAGSFLGTLDGVSEAELNEYMKRKSAELDAKHLEARANELLDEHDQ